MKKTAALAAVGVAVLVLTGAKGCTSSGSGSDSGDVNKMTAISACEGSVKKQLKAPSTADFSGEHARQVTSTKILVRGNVDAENSFGAKLRSSWSGTAVTRNGGDSWLCIATLHE